MLANKKMENQHPLTLDTLTSGEAVSNVNYFQKVPQLTNGSARNRISPMSTVSYTLVTFMLSWMC